MRLLLLSILVLPLLAQEAPPAGEHKGGHPPPKNLQLLKPEQVMPMMRSFKTALGAECTLCHVEGDFASDEKPEKKTARMMISMTRDINAKFSDGEMHVTCFTCHRGSEHPLTKPE